MAYKLTHPNSEHEIEVDAAQVAIYVSQGWETAPTAKPPVVEPESKSSTTK